jgi:hypothetical protein
LLIIWLLLAVVVAGLAVVALVVIAHLRRNHYLFLQIILSLLVAAGQKVLMALNPQEQKVLIASFLLIHLLAVALVQPLV